MCLFTGDRFVLRLTVWVTLFLGWASHAYASTLDTIVIDSGVDDPIRIAIVPFKANGNVQIEWANDGHVTEFSAKWHSVLMYSINAFRHLVVLPLDEILDLSFNFLSLETTISTTCQTKNDRKGLQDLSTKTGSPLKYGG